MNLPLTPPSILPTHENRLAYWLALHGVQMTTDQYMTRYLNYIRRLAGMGLDAETMDRLIAQADADPRVVLEDRSGEDSGRQDAG